MIPGLDPTSLTDLGQAVRRDPDALPPRNALERTMNWLYHIATEIGGGNALFALKAGILTSETFRSFPRPEEFRYWLDYSHSSVAVVPRVICVFRI